MNGTTDIPPALRNVKITTTIEIDVIGRIWQGIECAQSYTISDRQIKRGGDGIVVAGDLWIEDGGSEIDAVDRWVSTNTGDFADITSMRVVKTERAAYAQPVKDDGWDVSTNYSRTTVLRDFTEDEDMQFSDIMFPAED